jgi:fumarate reductase flavoprotein subunit
MLQVDMDIIVAGGGGAGLRAAIAAAEASPSLDVALVSKVYPMRSHTEAAEGGAAAVTLKEDSLQSHFLTRLLAATGWQSRMWLSFL